VCTRCGNEVTEDKGFQGSSGEVQAEGARSRIELSVSDVRGVDIEEEKRRSLLGVDFDAQIV